MRDGRTTRIIVTAVMMVSALSISANHASAVVPGRDGKIVFTRSNQVYTINANGTGLVQLTTGLKNYWPRWSPDGKRIAYVHEVAKGKRDLWVMSATGANKKQVTKDGSVTAPAWSPDGRFLAFGGTGTGTGFGTVLKQIKSSAPFGASQLLTVVNQYGTFPVRVYSNPTWSSKGEIAMYGDLLPDDESNSSEFTIYRPATKALRSILNLDPSDADGVSFPSYSADGAVLAITIAYGNNDGYYDPRSIRMLSSADGADLPFQTVALDAQLAFSPSGTQVVLMNDAAGAPTIYIAKRDGSGRRALTAGYQPDWQRLP